MTGGHVLMLPAMALAMLRRRHEYARARVAALPDEVVPRPRPPVVPLSERELAVVRLLAEGCSNREIAADLYLAQGTVKNHVTALLGKLGARDRTQAALRARALGLL